VLNHDEAVDYLNSFDGIDPEVLQPDLLSDGSWLLERREFWASLLYDGADEELLDGSGAALAQLLGVRKASDRDLDD